MLPNSRLRSRTRRPREGAESSSFERRPSRDGRKRFSSMRGTRIEVDFRTCSVSRDDLWPVDSSCARSPVLCERFKWEINIKRPFTTPSNKQLDSSFWWARFHPDFRRGQSTVCHLEMCFVFAGIFEIVSLIFLVSRNYGNGRLLKKMWFRIVVESFRDFARAK